jgi:hypothetical protein
VNLELQWVDQKGAMTVEPMVYSSVECLGKQSAVLMAAPSDYQRAMKSAAQMADKSEQSWVDLTDAKSVALMADYLADWSDN